MPCVERDLKTGRSAPIIHTSDLIPFQEDRPECRGIPPAAPDTSKRRVKLAEQRRLLYQQALVNLEPLFSIGYLVSCASLMNDPAMHVATHIGTAHSSKVCPLMNARQRTKSHPSNIPSLVIVMHMAPYNNAVRSQISTYHLNPSNSRRYQVVTTRYQSYELIKVLHQYI
jgi:hypothetical protein